MKVKVLLEQRFSRTPDGAVYAPVIYTHYFFTRYLDVFDEVEVVARVKPEPAVPADWLRCDGPGVGFFDVPHYIGPYQYLRRYFAVRGALRRSVLHQPTAYIARVPSFMFPLATQALIGSGHPYAVEVIGDPDDVLSAGATASLLRAYMRKRSVRDMKHQCANACAASYVTKFALQKKYPPGAGAFTTHYSSIILKPESFVDQPRTFQARDRYRLIFVGHMDQMYKAPDTLIQAAGVCASRGFKIEVVFCGDGRHRAEMETLAAQQTGAEIKFLGNISSPAALRDELDKSDLFVLPTRAEGLPRSVMEAMARALPCISTSVGGVPELLPDEDRVPLNDPSALADRIIQFLSDGEAWTRRSARNLEVSQEYREDILRERRKLFYTEVKNRTATWLQARGLASTAQ